MMNPWNDPRVKDALKEGRSAHDIQLLACPKCGHYGYYNEGSHFTCLDCDVDFYARSEEERIPAEVPSVLIERVSLADLDLTANDVP